MNSPVVSKDNEAESVVWNTTRFGVTTSEENNKIQIDKENKTVILSAGNKEGTATGGKVTGSNDGMSYYYTAIDKSKNFEISADVTVNYFEKAKPDKQCGFGIMVRDTLGVENDISVAPSNMCLVGGYKGMVQSVFRNGVTSDLSSKIVMENVHKFGDRPVNDGTAKYKLKLKKTNTGYIASVDDGEEVTYYRPKQLEVVDKDNVYVGFFVARVAGITVSNIELHTSDVATDPVGEKEPEAKVKLSIKVNSAKNTGSSKYDLDLNSTVNGKVTVKQGDKELYSGDINANTSLKVPTTLEKGNNKFDVTYTTTEGEPIEVSHKVTYKNGDTGLQISTDTNADRSVWPSYNLILKCDSYDNMDADMNNADGFAAKITCGEGNVFRQCISHNNCDDGWDLFSKLEIGGISPVLIEDCITYGNGTLTDGTKTSGDGNSNPAVVVENTVSTQNDKNFRFDYYTNAELLYSLKNVYSYETKEHNEDEVPSMAYGDTVYLFDGTKSANASGKVLEASAFKSTEMPSGFERDLDNNIIWGDYMQLVTPSEDNKDNQDNKNNQDDKDNKDDGNDLNTGIDNKKVFNEETSELVNDDYKGGFNPTNNNATKTGDAGALGILGLGFISLAGMFASKKNK